MTFHYNPQDASDTWADGDYKAEIHRVEERQSRAGNDMVEIVVKVFNGDGAHIFVRDYIVCNLQFHLQRLKKLCAACEPEIDFEAGELDTTQLVDQTVMVTLKTEDGQDGFEDRNVVKTYMRYVGKRKQKKKKVTGTTVSLPEKDIVKADVIPF